MASIIKELILYMVKFDFRQSVVLVAQILEQGRHTPLLPISAF